MALPLKGGRVKPFIISPIPFPVDFMAETGAESTGIGRTDHTPTIYNKHAKKVTTKQLAEFDRLAQQVLEGDPGERVFVEGAKHNRFGGFDSYAVIRQMNDLYKSVQGRSFDRADANSDGRRLFYQIGNLADAQRRVQAATAGETKEVTLATDFLKESKRIDSFRASDYWSTPHEMGARAFEAFVNDSLRGGEQRSDYLVAGTENKAYALFDMKPYPEALEREAINKAFTDLFQVVKAEPTDRGVALREDAAAYRPQGESDEALRQRVLSTEPVRITGDEITRFHEPLDMKDLRERVRAWADEHLVGTVRNAHTGWEIIVSHQGIKADVSHGSGPEKLQSLAGLHAMLEHATLLDSHPSDTQPGVVIHVFVVPAEISGRDYVVGLVIREAHGQRFYDHELLERKGLGAVTSQSGVIDSQGVSTGLPAPSQGQVQSILRRVLGVNGTQAPQRRMMPAPRSKVRESEQFLNMGQRGATQDAEYSRRNPAKAWPEKFPNVATETSLQALAGHADYVAAKAGDVEAAGRVVLALAKPDKARALAEKFPGATLVPVRAEEASGTNALPVVYAQWLSHATGMPVSNGLVQTNVVGRTGTGQWHRMATRPTFDGVIDPGREYVLVDDVVTGGGSLSELRRAIEARGGCVVGATTLAAAQFSQNMALSTKTRLALESTFGINSLRDLLKSEGIYGGEHAALTESEARTLLSAGSVDAVRSRLAQARVDEAIRTRPRILPPPRAGVGAQGPRVGELSAADSAEVVAGLSGAIRASFGELSHSAESRVVLSTLARSVPAALSASSVPYQMDLFAHVRSALPMHRDARIASQRTRIEKVLRGAGMWQPETIQEAMGTSGEGRLGLLLSDVVWGMPAQPLYLDVPQGYRIESPRDVAALMWPLRTPTHERVTVVALGKDGTVLSARVASVGTLNSASITPQIVFGALPEGTTGVVVTHNHPSGDAQPSSEDVQVTRQLVEAGKALGIPVVGATG